MLKFISTPSKTFSIAFDFGGSLKFNLSSIKEEYLNYFISLCDEYENFVIKDNFLYIKLPVSQMNSFLCNQIDSYGDLTCNRLLAKNLDSNTFVLFNYEEKRIFKSSYKNIPLYSKIVFSKKINDKSILIEEGYYLGDFRFVTFFEANEAINISTQDKISLAYVNGEVVFIEDIFQNFENEFSDECRFYSIENSSILSSFNSINLYFEVIHNFYYIENLFDITTFSSETKLRSLFIFKDSQFSSLKKYIR